MYSTAFEGFCGKADPLLENAHMKFNLESSNEKV